MKAFSFSLLIALLFAGFAVTAQTSETPEINPKDPAFRQKYENVDFKGKFSVQVLKDNTNNYFLVDFAQLKDKYEKVYFLSLVFINGKVVNIDGDLKQNKIWFLSDNRNTIEEINTLFQKLKEQTTQSSSALSGDQKASWLLENDKYK
jgi:hypothetical protein